MYQLAATRGAPIAVADYYGGGAWSGIALWFSAALLLAGVWAALWRPQRRQRALTLVLALILTALPPVGAIAWTHPLTAAGAVFPGTGWFGLALTIILAVAFSVYSWRFALATVFILCGVAALRSDAVMDPAGWEGIDTHFAFNPRDLGEQFDRQLALTRLLPSESEIAVFPESAAGIWGSASERIWRRGVVASGATAAIVGAQVSEADGRETNALVLIDHDGSRVIYRQRMPVLFSMWHPFCHTGTHAYWFESPVVEVNQQRIAVLICHEQTIVWPVLHSMLYRPRVLLGCSNLWWAGGTSLPRVQENSLKSWARLFGIPCVSASNVPG